MKIATFRDLDVWKPGKDIVLEVYRATPVVPKDEVYGLVSQMRKASVSIPSIVAEGFNRLHNKDYRQFLYVALGSCAELRRRWRSPWNSDISGVNPRTWCLRNSTMRQECSGI